jgi:putative transposase
VIATSTVSLHFKFRPTKGIEEILGKVKVMEQKAVSWLVNNKKTSLGSVHHALYFPLREQFPELHSQWVISALKTATSIVHAFNKRKRKGKAKRPKLKRPFVTLSPHLFKVSFNGKWLKVTIFKSANDLEPIVLWFKPHHKYRRLLDEWRAGKCTLGQITLTRNSINIPLKFPDVPMYQPQTVIGIDSNENSLDYCVLEAKGDGQVEANLGTIDTSEVARINRDYDRRVQKATKGKRNPKAKKKVQAKYGRLRRERTKNLWHLIASMLIRMAVRQQRALVLECLNGMKTSLKNTSKRIRQRLLNYWSIMTFHRILEAKARAYGVPIVFVNPRGTSRTCPICGDCLRGQAKVCPSCGLSRHYVAAINIAHRGIEKFPSLLGLGQGSVGDPRRPSSDGTVVRFAAGCHGGNLCNLSIA